MPKFSKYSKLHLGTCDDKLMTLFYRAITLIDFKVLCGYRDKKEQNMLFDQDLSKVKWPNSKHNQMPSLAIDIAPYPVNWKDIERFVLFAGVIMGMAYEMGIALRWGGDWNMNWQVSDEKFRDYGHFELIT